jgi:hypothetical protein
MFDFFSGKSREPVECIITVGGSEITSLFGYLVEVIVRASRANGAEGSMKFESRRGEDGIWVVQDDARITPWAEIKITAKFGDTEEEVLRGYVKKVNSRYPPEGGGSTITVEFQDSSILLDRTQRRKVWGADPATDDLSIIEEMLRGTGLSLDSESSGFSGLTLNQNATDVRFLRARQHCWIRAHLLGRSALFRPDETGGRAAGNHPRLCRARHQLHQLFDR